MRTDGHDETNSRFFRNFAKVPKNCRNNAAVSDVKGELVLGISLRGKKL